MVGRRAVRSRAGTWLLLLLLLLLPPLRRLRATHMVRICLVVDHMLCWPLSLAQVVLRQLPNDVQYRVIARGEGADPAVDAAALADYFNLSHSLAALSPSWCSACDRFAAVHPLLPGARMLRQDPVECLFQVGSMRGRRE